jgi:uncharacterized OB-fold protein
MQDSVQLAWRRYPERYALIGNYCDNCGEDFFPGKVVCPNCGREGKLTQKEMPKTGKIISYSEVMVGPQGFEGQTPYTVAIIELENKVRLLSQVVDSKKEEIKIGAKVKKVFRKISDPHDEAVISYGFKFKVVK